MYLVTFHHSQIHQSSYFVFTVIADVVHADQHRHHLPVLLEVQTLKKTLWLSLVAKEENEDCSSANEQNEETYWIRLERVYHVLYLIGDISVEGQTQR